LHCVILVVNVDNECVVGKLILTWSLWTNGDLVDVVILLIIKEVFNSLLAFLRMIIESDQVFSLWQQQLFSLNDLSNNGILHLKFGLYELFNLFLGGL